MASIINNNGLGLSRGLRSNEKSLFNTLSKLSTGSRINRASDDAAGLQISNNLRSDLRVLGKARQNANIGLGITNIADGALSSASDLLNRAAEIATQAASGTTSSEGREALNSEFQEILGQLDSLGENTKFDGEAIFGNSTSVRTGEESSQTVDIDVDSLSAADVGLGGTDLLSEGNASAALEAIGSAVESVSSSRGSIGATQNRLSYTVDAINITSENIQAAESQIRDADVADEVVNLTKFQILSKAKVSAIAQSNQIKAQSVLSLLNG